MRRCPTCQRTFEDGMKFCQADGTPLVDDVSQQSGGFDSAQSNRQDGFSDLDPMKTVVGAPPPDLPPPPSPFGDINAPNFGEPLPIESKNEYGQPRFDQYPNTPSFQEPEKQFGNQNFGQQQPFNNQPAEWTPPAAPQANWGTQGLGQNTAFSAPPVAQNSTPPLAIISLVLGILSITIGLCCYGNLLFGPAAIITGFLANKNIKQSSVPQGGRNLAIAGMVTGAIATLIGVVMIVFVLISIIAAPR